MVMQFKLVCKNSFRTLNTFTFINVPLQRLADNNVSTLLEIMKKFKKPQRPTANKGKSDFMPYNKSILTRVIA